MSNEATQGAWERLRTVGNGLAATRRIVLLALADAHNSKTGQCNPSLARLISDTGMHRNTIPPAIRDLEERGLLTVSRMFGSGSSYSFPWLTSTEIRTDTSTEIRTSTEISTSTEIRTPTSTEIRTQNQEENQERRERELMRAREEVLQPESTKPGADGTENSKRFDEFWAAYPKKKSKGDARKAWNKLKLSEQLYSRIMTAIEQAKTSTDWTKDDGQFIPYPASWLNAEGWEDDFKQRKTPAGANHNPGFIGNNQPGKYRTKHQAIQDETVAAAIAWLNSDTVN